MDTTITPGNVIVIEHAPGEYAHYCHLRAGSAKVRPGQLVVAGQQLGQVGNSGNTSEPHLHFHVQSDARMAGGLGIEPRFQGVCRREGDTFRPVDDYRALKGDVVIPCDRLTRK